jgi:hypothetical protein
VKMLRRLQWQRYGRGLQECRPDINKEENTKLN